MRDANRRSGMTALIAEQLGDEIRRAVHRLGQGVEARLDAKEAAEPHDPPHLVEIAERRMRLGEDVDDAEPRRLARGLDFGISRELALVALGKLAVFPQRELTRDKQQRAS